MSTGYAVSLNLFSGLLESIGNIASLNFTISHEVYGVCGFLDLAQAHIEQSSIVEELEPVPTKKPSSKPPQSSAGKMPVIAKMKALVGSNKPVHVAGMLLSTVFVRECV